MATNGNRQSGKQRTVLVVEDDPYISELLQTILGEEGYAAVPAYDGERALELARLMHPSLVTLDLVLPLLDGCQVLEVLKADDATRDIPVIVLSACVDTLGRSGRKLAARVVEKPFDLNQLVAIVDEVGRAN